MTSSHRMVGLVLAGGAARRIGGGDKPLRLLAGRPMLHWVLAALAQPRVAISANGDPARFAGFGLPVLSDGAFAGQGPLAGLLAGLEWAGTLGAETLLTAPGDTPFLPAGLSQVLSPAPAAASSSGRRHHLVATWPVSSATALRSLLAQPGPRRVERFCELIGMRYVTFPVPAFDPFMNVNTHADMARAEAIAAGLVAGRKGDTGW